MECLPPGWTEPETVTLRTGAQFAGGHANLTYLVRFGDHEYILRRPPGGPLAAGAYDRVREFRALSALWPVLPAASRPYFFCDDASVLGAPFLSWSAEAVWSSLETCPQNKAVGRACIPASARPLWTPWLTFTR